MKNKMIVIMLVFALLFLTAIPAFAEDVITENNVLETYTIDTAYVFPITSDSPEWDELLTLSDMLAACQIPEEILSRLTNEALLETIANYPLGVNLFAYGDAETCYNKVKQQFNGLAELDRRLKSNPNEMLATVNSFSQANISRLADTETYEDVYINRLNVCISAAVAEEGSSVAPRYTSTYVRTPNGSRVQAYKDFTWTDMYYNFGHTEESEQLVCEEYQDVYDAELLAGINPSYNCHSYAWHDASTNNRYWINNPSAYITDGSYDQLTHYYVGSVILYGSTSAPEHSAIIDAVSENHLTYVISKWGDNGLFRHLYNRCPYDGGVTTYRES